MATVENAYPCPCCGHMVFSNPPGSDDICLVCFWEDDLMQLRWPYLAGQANVPCLAEAQQNYLVHGAIEPRFKEDVCAPTAEQPRAPDWRPIAESDVFEDPEDSAPWPEDRTELYYWRRQPVPTPADNR